MLVRYQLRHTPILTLELAALPNSIRDALPTAPHPDKSVKRAEKEKEGFALRSHSVPSLLGVKISELMNKIERLEDWFRDILSD